jgi:hypothetical protein
LDLGLVTGTKAPEEAPATPPEEAQSNPVQPADAPAADAAPAAWQ